MASKRDPEKSVDVPPTGSRNADPITKQPGSHPVETGIGAALGGAATGAAVGTVAGPLGTAIGAVAGAVAGGLAGKGVGELIDPTTEDNWLRDNFSSRPYVRQGDTFDTYQNAYRYGGELESQYRDRSFADIENDLESDWSSRKDRGNLSWQQAKAAVRDAYDRSGQIRRHRLGTNRN